jgi:hypothetical protein
MKTIFDKTTRDDLIARINLLDEHAKAQWGKMNAFQMVNHCALYEDMMLGKTTAKRVFLGYLFDKWALKGLIKDETPLKPNMPTIKSFITKQTAGDFEADKRKWITLIEEYGQSACTGILHPFFGQIKKEQIGYLVYKHTDHHLRQFNH